MDNYEIVVMYPFKVNIQAYNQADAVSKAKQMMFGYQGPLYFISENIQQEAKPILLTVRKDDNDGFK